MKWLAASCSWAELGLLLLLAVVDQGKTRSGGGGVLRDELAGLDLRMEWLSDLDLRVKLVVVVLAAAGCVTRKDAAFNQPKVVLHL